MDDTEARARQYLIAQGFEDPRFEPDGQVPPDFLVGGGAIAIEVQRLTQRERDIKAPRALEELAIPLIQRIQELAASFGPPRDEAWLIALDFKRPLPRWRHLRSGVNAFFKDLQRGGLGRTLAAYVHPNLYLRATPGSPIREEMFHLGTVHDDDSGGWQLEQLTLSLNHSIIEKTAKVVPYFGRYPEWWLILMDHVSYARPLDSNFGVLIPQLWARVILVNPLNPQMGIIVPRSAA